MRLDQAPTGGDAMTDTKLGALALASGINPNTLRILIEGGFIPVLSGGKTSGDHRRFGPDGVIFTACIAVLMRAGLSVLPAAKVISAFAAHQHVGGFDLMEIDMRRRDDPAPPSESWQATDVILDLYCGRYLFASTPAKVCGQGEPILIGIVQGDVRARGSDITVEHAEHGSVAFKEAHLNRVATYESLLRANLSAATRLFLERLDSQERGLLVKPNRQGHPDILTEQPLEL
jgi:hypothetical protein